MPSKNRSNLGTTLVNGDYAYASLIFFPYAYASLNFFQYAYAYHMQAYAYDMHMHVIYAYAFDNTIVKPIKQWKHESYGAVNGISYDACILKVSNLNDAQPESCKSVESLGGAACWSPLCLSVINAHAAPGRHCWVAG